MRAIHIKYGLGYIIYDVGNLCNADEVMFKPDDGIFDRLIQPDSRKALSVVAPYDIVNKSDVT